MSSSFLIRKKIKCKQGHNKVVLSYTVNGNYKLA